MNELIELVNKLRREHYICEDDCYLSCPLAVNEDGESACCNDSWLSANTENAHKCTCGADEHNALVDEVIERLKGDNSILFTCPDCGKVTVDPADVKALEEDNARLREYIERLESKLYDIVGSKRDFDELLMTIKAE